MWWVIQGTIFLCPLTSFLPSSWSSLCLPWHVIFHCHCLRSVSHQTCRLSRILNLLPMNFLVDYIHFHVSNFYSQTDDVTGYNWCNFHPDISPKLLLLSAPLVINISNTTRPNWDYMSCLLTVTLFFQQPSSQLIDCHWLGWKSLSWLCYLPHHFLQY